MPGSSDRHCVMGDAGTERHPSAGLRKVCAPFQGKEQRNEEARLAGRRKRASMLNMCLTGRMPAIEKINVRPRNPTAAGRTTMPSS